MCSKEETLTGLNEIREAMEEVWTQIESLKFISGNEYQILNRLVGNLDKKISALEEKVNK